MKENGLVWGQIRKTGAAALVCNALALEYVSTL